MRPSDRDLSLLREQLAQGRPEGFIAWLGCITNVALNGAPAEALCLLKAFGRLAAPMTGTEARLVAKWETQLCLLGGYSHHLAGELAPPADPRRVGVAGEQGEAWAPRRAGASRSGSSLRWARS
jgi:hypothetical protein